MTKAADLVFIEAFDAAIDKACKNLSSKGLGEDAIWSAFRKATQTMCSLSNAVDSEQPPTSNLTLHVIRSRHRQSVSVGN